jgi:hypothetical protein
MSVRLVRVTLVLNRDDPTYAPLAQIIADLQQRQRRREVHWGALQAKLRDWLFTGYKLEVLLRQIGPEGLGGPAVDVRTLLEQAPAQARSSPVSETAYARVLDGLEDLLDG